jgi:hypothetical protein
MRMDSDRESFDSSASAPPRSLSPIVTTKRPIIPALSVNSGFVSALEEATIKLAEKSNYQHIIEGTNEQLGLGFDPAVKSGFPRRKINHKVAEKRRRDDMRHWFDNLKSVLHLNDDTNNDSKRDGGPQRKVVLQKGMEYYG